MRCPTLAELPPPPPGKTGWPWTEESPQLPDTLPDGSPWPRISIVTPSYNQGRFIEETIRSVLLQGYPDLEYIIIDGGSTDESVEVIRKYEPWLAYWVSEPDRGQSHAINKGFGKARGEIIAWLNSDDVYLPGTFGKVVSQFNREQTAGLIYARARICDQNRFPTGQLVGRKFSIDQLFEGRNPVAQPSAFFRHDCFRRVSGLNENFHFAMDHDLWIRMGLLSKAIFVDDVWSEFRTHPVAKSSSGRLYFEEEIYQSVHHIINSKNVPPGLFRERRSVLGTLLLRLAIYSHGHGLDSQGRRYIFQALRQDLGLIRNWHLFRFFLQCILGRKTILRIKSLGLSNQSQ
ncbi:MAG: hypothetical protein KatS3mg050_0946 [Litorilinea sp.]|nr:MAG: hypothetical protein KatS3mg050_0946 [Litorilinea sp.]